MSVTVKERILSIRLLEKAEKQAAFAATLGLMWSVSQQETLPKLPSICNFEELKGEREWSI